MAWEFATATAGETQRLAENLAGLLRAGDLVILSGGLGAGKTTFTQGLGRSLGVREGIISPTFVLVRIHPNLADGPRPGGPDLVHVDAYRLGSEAEIDDIDLENTMDSAVTVVEWGAGRVEHLSANRLEIELGRSTGGRYTGSGTPGEASGGDGVAPGAFEADDADEPRTVRLNAVGPRWDGVDFSVLDGTGTRRPAGPHGTVE
ncbi:tRNA (adenosine(37)-N6)-threonylcarbamoyltransferase complex ATPase subunit type 1 TsaE [Arthrobacter sp. STN4]|uniref:tRNA (adenosine(37)-N6)-threonylcarbamoyltransferase complex ATPase subunit type 1 TsaE n=1 Tax=Arthrobacter sp. STN4 TaxID=2923276 RepID=UPI00211A18F1|nr:tRNA (adenosine(37)-N6)-threonylcarbamoyltransferase complex ATPase subunit type 1 TsaE [Arthrobacter sp. STN4]MCQ9164641.1 tRNA (adenosine(37)-N6)-threonylcarbamoyltransferase complex ATPase subunit type 1 TsaE [Arthrobacter sp. STN4]